MCINLNLDLDKYLLYKGDFSGRHYLAYKSFNMFNYDNKYKKIELYGKFRDLYKYEFEENVFGLISIVDNKMQMVMNVLSSYLFNAELGYHGYFQRTLKNRYDLYNYQNFIEIIIPIIVNEEDIQIIDYNDTFACSRFTILKPELLYEYYNEINFTQDFNYITFDYEIFYNKLLNNLEKLK